MKNNRRFLGTEKVGRLIWRLSLPSTVGMMVMASYNIADAIFIGRGVGPIGLASVAICFPLQLLGAALAIMAGVGGASVISRSLGAGDMARAQRAFGAMIALAVVLGLLVASSGLLLLPRLLRFFGATEAMLPHSRAYLSVILFGLPLQMFAMAGNNAARAEGRARIAMTTMLISAILNIILDPVFIFWFGWGVRGAAVATVISQAFMFVWIFGYFYSGRSLLRFGKELFRPDGALLREIAAIGSSEFVRMAAGSLSLVLVNAALVRWGGDVHVAVFGVIHRTLLLLFMPLMGIAQGLQPIVGYNYGAGLIDRARQAVRLALIAGTALSLGAFLIVQLFPEEIFSVFSSDETLLKEGARAMRIITRMIFVVGFQIIGSAMFQALGKARPAFILSLSRQVLLLIPFVLILPTLLGSTDGIWLAFPLADALATIVTFILFRREAKNHLAIRTEPV